MSSRSFSILFHDTGRAHSFPDCILPVSHEMGISINSSGVKTRGAHLHCLRMASYIRARSQIFLTASLAVLNVALMPWILKWSSSMVLRLSICWSQLQDIWWLPVCSKSLLAIYWNWKAAGTSRQDGYCYEIQYTWTARSTETETETGLDRYVMLGARWLTEY